MIPRLLISLAIKLLLDLPMMLMGLVIVPLGLLFERDNHMPRWAEGFWGNCDHGNDGGEFWARKTIGWPRFWRCFWWLAIRNPAFNFAQIIGVLVFMPDAIVIIGNPNIGDKKAGGWYWATYWRSWEFYYIRPYTMLGTRRCVRFRAGWKLKGRQTYETAPFVFAFNPVMPYHGA